MAKHFLTLVIPVGAVLAFLGQGGCEALDDRPKTVGDFCGEYARRECEPTAVICSRNRAECEPIRRAACEAFVAPLASASRVFRRENAEACLAQVTETYKKNVITATDLDALADKCDRVVEGPGMSNATCDADQDCRSPLVCDKNRCGPLRMVPAGGNCANPGEVCPATEYCRADSGLAVCTGRPDKGAACSASLPCRPTLRCDGTCQDKLGANSPCGKRRRMHNRLLQPASARERRPDLPARPHLCPFCPHLRRLLRRELVLRPGRRGRAACRPRGRRKLTGPAGIRPRRGAV